MKQYIVPFLLVVAWIVAVLTDTISIQQSLDVQSSALPTANSPKQVRPRGYFQLSGLQHISGELLISPKMSRPRRSQIIQSSQDFLYVRMYNITHKESRTLIKSLAKSWVSVRMILEDKQYGSTNKDYVRGRGIQTQNDSKLKTNFMHAKTLISSGFYIIQTANLTFGAFEKQREYYVIGTDPQIQYNLKQLFNKDRDGLAMTTGDIHPNLLLCPIDCREKIIWLLRWAKQSIVIQNQYISDPEIMDVLQTQQHLDINITLPKNKENEVTAAQLSGHIRLLSSPYIHAKTLLIDDSHLLISSINFSSNSLDNNREIGIVLTDKQSIEQFKKQFQQDRDKAR